MPSNVWGRVYCGYSSSPFSKLSSAWLSAAPRTPGMRRTTASSSAIAATSPPARTKSPIETSSRPRASMTRWSMPSKRPQTMTAPGPAASSRDAGLGQRLSARAHQQLWPRVTGGRDGVDGGGEDVGLQHHAGAAAGRRVIDRAVPVGGEIAELGGPAATRGLRPCRGRSPRRRAGRGTARGTA